jgi:pimeloyl-ACP methyl ester carboxylesterase
VRIRRTPVTGGHHERHSRPRARRIRRRSRLERVYDELRSDEVDVRVVQNPTRSLADDAVVTRDVLDAVDGPVVLVGHSYGGAVISEAGTHPDVAALVYITAFAPDSGESVGSIIDTFPTDGPQPPIPRRSTASCSWIVPSTRLVRR